MNINDFMNLFQFSAIERIIPFLPAVIPKPQFHGHASGGTHNDRYFSKGVALRRRRNRIASISRRINRMRAA